MKLYKGCTRGVAIAVRDHGFYGEDVDLQDLTGPIWTEDPDRLVWVFPEGSERAVEAAGGFRLVWAFQASSEPPGEVAGGFRADGAEFLLSIDVPDELARRMTAEWQLAQVPGTSGPDLIEGRATDEVWLSPEQATKYLPTLTIYNAQNGEPVRPTWSANEDRDHAVRRGGILGE